MKEVIKFGRANKWYYFPSKDIVAIKLTEKTIGNNMIAIPYTQRNGEMLLSFFDYNIGDPKKNLLFESEENFKYRINLTTENKDSTKRRTDLCRLSWDSEFGYYLKNIDLEKYQDDMIRAKSKGYEAPLFYLEIKKYENGVFYITNKKSSTEFWYHGKSANETYYSLWEIKNEYEQLLSKLPDAADLETIFHVRKEQQILRKLMIGDKVKIKCGICDSEYPVEFIWCSHIKRRSACTLEEKLDIENIVMPMCKFGCDDLYEKKYIYVEDGEVKLNTNTKLNKTNELDVKISDLEGRKIHNKFYNKNTVAYFEWHKNS